MSHHRGEERHSTMGRIARQKGEDPKDLLAGHLLLREADGLRTIERRMLQEERT